MELSDFSQSLESLNSIIQEYSDLEKHMNHPPPPEPRLQVVTWKQSMWKIPVFVKDTSLCERCQSMWKIPVYVKDTSLCERYQSWGHDWKIMSRSSKNIEFILQWAKDKLFFKTG